MREGRSLNSKLLERLPKRVTVVEVGPRDGLQNEKFEVPAAVKLKFISALATSGLRIIEATSFVDPRWVPQLSDAEQVLAGLDLSGEVRYPVLVPNEKGYERAIAHGAKEVSIFASATESFSQKNLNRSRDEAIEMFRPVAERASNDSVRVRAYLSMVLGDPWEGDVPITAVADAAIKLMDLGCEELSLGDTIGVGTPGKVQDLIAGIVRAGIDVSRLAVHFHDTYGQGLANVLAALETGVSVVDSSAAGLGGCPFAKSATGNLATEDLIWMLDGLGIETGVDVNKVADAGAQICRAMGKDIPGRAARALTS